MMSGQRTTTYEETGSFCRLPAASFARNEIAIHTSVPLQRNQQLHASTNNVNERDQLACHAARTLGRQPASCHGLGTAVAFAELFGCLPRSCRNIRE
jgi:hypothetical protein